MRRALALAARGRYTTSPNPAVGCVIVSANGDVVAEGWHQRAGEPHAEIVALKNAGSNTEGATVYVTLEPCAHTGRTPPCVEALIAARVAKVVSAMSDPNPQVAGEGYRRLRAAGIEVVADVLRDEARALNRGYVSRYERGRPFVRCKLAMSMDGRTAMASGQSQWISCAESRRRVHQLRAESCAIITGIGTVLADKPKLNVRESELGQAVSRQPLLVVLDTQARLPADAAVLESDRSVWQVVAGQSNGEMPLQALAAEPGVKSCRRIEIPLDRGRLDLPVLMSSLAEAGCGEVLLEAGPRVAASFLSADLIDELMLFVAPKIMGAEAKPLFDLRIDTIEESIQYEWLGVESVGDDLLLVAAPKRKADK
ncbi:bifunctional diaminohydroxyphosphoribosylaminopyrimidine deaminase/5-amino-6-(5-phosphoribosylamino)uracil reductase RibD [bacterium]|nr:bifunctional diaminohydroxyphosphoribosylaminopyrimidine deaminase/5-amino-6-(5-phosphoribosylamino)uracil reductase RibD [bacterium]